MNRSVLGSVFAISLAVSAFARAQPQLPDPREVRAAEEKEVQAYGRVLRRAAPEIRQRFIDIERFARLPAEQQAAGIPTFYGTYGAELGPSFQELAANGAPPTFLLVSRQEQLRLPRNADTQNWGKELDQAATQMSPEQIADATVQNWSSNVLLGASRRRAIYVLLQHKPQVIPLIEQDMAAGDPSSARRAFEAVHDLELSELVSRCTDVYLSSGPTAELARRGLDWVVSDPTSAKRLIDDVEKNPESLKKHVLLLSSMLRNQKADERLLKLLESSDAQTRYLAATALHETDDPAVLSQVPKLLADTDGGVRQMGTETVMSASATNFAMIRPDLLKLLDWPDVEVQIKAAVKLAGQKDPASGPALLKLIRDPALRPLQRASVIIATRTLLESREALTEPAGQDIPAARMLEEWIRAHPDRVR